MQFCIQFVLLGRLHIGIRCCIMAEVMCNKRLEYQTGAANQIHASSAKSLMKSLRCTQAFGIFLKAGRCISTQ